MQIKNLYTYFEEFILENGIHTNFKKDQAIFLQNSPVYSFFFIQKGLIKLHKSQGKKRCSIIKVEKSGDFVGLFDCFSGGIHHFSATAITNTDISILDAASIMKYIHTNPLISETVMNLLAQESIFFLEKLTNRYHKQLPGRIADILLYFRDLFSNGDAFQLPLNRTELAQMAGTTKESLIRTLTEFKNDKIIQLKDREVEINSLEILQTLSRLG
jgi:CRP-like cAMP-binding protein